MKPACAIVQGQYTDQDALFSSVLGLMQVKTSVYASERDLFAKCTGTTTLR